MSRAFITGSQAYGKPNDKSDLDVVVLVDSRTQKALEALSDSEDTIRFGGLNIIACQTEEEMAVWRVATRKMMLDAHRESRGLKTRDKKEAKAVLDVLRRSVGIFDNADSGDDDD